MNATITKEVKVENVTLTIRKETPIGARPKFVLYQLELNDNAKWKPSYHLPEQATPLYIADTEMECIGFVNGMRYLSCGKTITIYC